MHMNRLRVRLLIPAIVLTAFSAPPLIAEMNVDGMIKYRQNVMKSLGGHVGAVDRLVRGQVPLMDQLEMHATAARDIAGTITTLFPADSIPPEAEFSGATVATEALASIAEKPEEFEKAARETIDATEELVKVVQTGNQQELPLAFKRVGESCKGCHKDFREKKE
jgi:cytochrome c556